MKIVVLAGGTSTERDVSFVTGSMVYKALKERNHQAVLIDVFYGIDRTDYEEVFKESGDYCSDLATIGGIDPDIEKIKAMRPKSPDGYFGPNVIRLCQSADIVFLALHGENGENGKIQAAFDLLEIQYTGTGYLSSALAMDKNLTKNIFDIYHIPTPSYVTIERIEDTPSNLEFPCVVKTACGGSSVGVYIVNNKEEYEEAVTNAISYQSKVIIEQYIKGREFSIGVVDGEAYPIIEIAPIQGFYDYKNKYQAGSAIETCPADLPESTAKKMQQCAEQAYVALGLFGYGRMDFMMNEKEEFFCLEANTLPGMTPTSLLPQEAAAKGISFGELCEKLIQVSKCEV